MNPAIATAVLTAISVIVVALIKRNETLKSEALKASVKELTEENNRLKADKKELMTSFNALEIVTDLRFFNVIKEKVEFIFNNTNCDRFLIMFAVNGVSEFNFVNVIYEEHKEHPYTYLSAGAVSRYMNVRIDHQYRNMLKAIEREGFVVLDTNTMKHGMLKDYYEFEKVRHSLVSFISRLKKDETSDIVIYCSAATHSEHKYTHKEENAINLGISGIQAASNTVFLKNVKR